ncbi:MAG: tetratricopeptide repeat protein [Bacteroidales bacterium]
MKKIILLIFLISPLAISAQEADPLSEIKENMKKFQFARVVMLADEIINKDSTSTEAYILKARSLKELNNYSGALSTLEKVLSLDTADLSVISEMAALHTLTGNNQKAFEAFSKLALSDPENEYFILQMANSLYAAEAYYTAKKLYVGLLRKDSLNTWYLRQAGLCYTELKMTDSAMVYLDKTLQINNNDLLALSKLTNLYLNQKEYEAGLKLTESIREQDSTRKEINKLSGYFFYLLKQYEPSMQRFLQYLSQCQPGVPEKFGHKYMGLCLYKTENFQKAAEYFTEAYQADTTDAEVCFYLGVSYCRSMYSSEGIKYLNKTLNLILPSPEYLSKIYSEIGDAYNNQGDPLNALEYISKSWQADTTDPDWLFKLAYQYDYYLDDIKTALAYYQQHISLSSGKEENTEEMSYLDFSRKRVKEIGKGISISNYKRKNE